MAYNKLSRDSGSDEDNRRSEATRILGIIKTCDKFLPTDTEQRFLEKMSRGGPVTVREIFWLRDIKEKAIEA